MVKTRKEGRSERETRERERKRKTETEREKPSEKEKEAKKCSARETIVYQVVVMSLPWGHSSA